MAEFELLEALRYDSESGFSLLAAHLDRLCASASHFGFVCDRARVVRDLDAAVAALEGIYKVRLRLSRDGAITFETETIAPHSAVLRVALAPAPVRSDDEFLRHKTSRREVYEAALAARGDADDVLLWNEAGMITEASSANVVVRRGGLLLTPPVTAGLLPGTLRQHLLERGELREADLPVADVPGAEALYLINSVRGWRTARWVHNVLNT
jgi:para-aminobenzoate synthetase/4-amino-4-deoxychorismate lyase